MDDFAGSRHSNTYRDIHKFKHYQKGKSNQFYVLEKKQNNAKENDKNHIVKMKVKVNKSGNKKTVDLINKTKS